MGAWIETNKDKEQEQEELVAPYVGAWIETQTTMNSAKYMYVAPYVGAWIETIYGEDTCLSHCRTLCGCVDWNSERNEANKDAEVAPYVGAWIETLTTLKQERSGRVAPYVGAWIETQATFVVNTYHMKSHPMWVRGLKL